MTTITVTDQIIGTVVSTDRPRDLPVLLADWYPEAPVEVTATVQQLGRAIDRGDWQLVDEMSAYLALRVDVA